MFIKYKGNTSNLLSDLSRELGNTVNLKSSETVLKSYFYRLLKEVSVEERIQIVSSLPVYIKPFCHKDSDATEMEQVWFHPSKCDHTMKSVSKVLAKYIPSDKIDVIYSCIPPTIKQGISKFSMSV